ncbi:MAG: LysM peptidoglycan-binding domain-containing protein [Pseudomonadota bacterium]
MKRTLKMGLCGMVVLLSMVLVVLCESGFGVKTDASGDDPFPVYPSMKKAVDFWKNVFTQYTTLHGIIHDSQNLDIIYEIVALEDQKDADAAKRNQNKIKLIKEKYKTVLNTLANGKSPTSEEEKRVLALFGERATQEALRTAQNSIRFQLGQKDRFRQGIIRSGSCLEEIIGVFRLHGLPEELAYLPHVESSFDYQAYSKFGAAGIWQFTHGTGKKYMTIDYTQDDRRDPIRASHAAAKYLKQSYEQLGSWPMAITAYNHGVNGMARAKQSAGDDFEQILSEYKGRSFGFASRNFYAEFLAAREVAGRYQKYFGDLQLDAPVKTMEIVLPGYVSVQDLVDYFNTDIKTLRNLNPALRNPVFLGQKYVPKGYRLCLPGHADQHLAKRADNIPATLLRSRQLPSRFYRVQKGDTAGLIARSQGVRLKDLILANGLDLRATVYVGQNLRIPVPGEEIMLASASENTFKPMKAVEVEVRPEKSPAAGQPDRKPAKPAIESRKAASAVKLSDRKMEATSPAREIQEQGPPSTIETEVNPAVVTGNFEVEKVVTEGRKTIGIIRVEAEETLGHYADWLGIATQAVRSLNGFRYGNPIRINQKIKIPLTKIGKEAFEEKRYEYHKELEEDFFSVYRIQGESVYTVKKGANVWRLCQQTFDLPFWLIKKYNTAQDFNVLRPDQKLRIPTVRKMAEESDSVSLRPKIE